MITFEWVMNAPTVMRARSWRVFVDVCVCVFIRACALSVCAEAGVGASRRLGETSSETSLERLAIQITTDKHHAVDARLALGPRRRRRTEVDLFVHALEDKLGVALALKAQDAL